jgi:hypothetical protein
VDLYILLLLWTRHPVVSGQILLHLEEKLPGWTFPNARNRRKHTLWYRAFRYTNAINSSVPPGSSSHGHDVSYGLILSDIV